MFQDKKVEDYVVCTRLGAIRWCLASRLWSYLFPSISKLKRNGWTTVVDTKPSQARDLIDVLLALTDKTIGYGLLFERWFQGLGVRKRDGTRCLKFEDLVKD